MNCAEYIIAISLQTLNEVLTAGNTEQARQAFLTQVCVSLWGQAAGYQPRPQAGG